VRSPEQRREKLMKKLQKKCTRTLQATGHYRVTVYSDTFEVVDGGSSEAPRREVEIKIMLRLVPIIEAPPPVKV